MAEDVLQKTYLSDAVRAAVDNSEQARQSFEQAIQALREAQQQRDTLLDRRETVAAKRLEVALERLLANKEKFAGTKRGAASFVLNTARGAAAQLQLAKTLPYLSETRRKALEEGKQSVETLRYLALARYLLDTTLPVDQREPKINAAAQSDAAAEESDAAAAEGVKAAAEASDAAAVKGVKVAAEASDAAAAESAKAVEASDAAAEGVKATESNVEKALSGALLLDESDLAQLSDEERESAREFKSRLLTLARRLQAQHAQYQDAIVHQQVMQMRLEQLEDATNAARRALKAADPEDVNATLQTLRGELDRYKALQEQLQRQESVRDLETLRLEAETTALELVRLVQRQRQLALDQLLRRLSTSLRAELQADQQLATDEAAAIQEAVDAIKEQRREGAEIAATRIAEAEQHIGQLEAALAEAQTAFADAEQRLRGELPEPDAFSLWPESLAGEQKAVEEAIVGAMRKFNVAKLRLEDAKPDEIDPATGKHKDCVLEDDARTLSEYQRALMHYVNDNFRALPGVLLLWEPGTGKTQGAISACVENIRVRYVEKPKDDAAAATAAAAVDVLILGFTNDNLNDFRKTLFATLERELRDRYEFGRSGGDEEASQQAVRLRITGNDGVVRTATIVIQRYSVGASLAPAMRVHSDGIVLVDEAHFMVTRQVPTASTNIAQVKAAVAAWERVVEEFDGVKLILTATPAGANRDPEMLLRLLQYMPRERGAGKETRDVKAYRRWFRERADGRGVEWASEEARREFERDWLRARISYVALRFDKRVFPQVETRCAGARPDDRQCVLEIGNDGALRPAADRPRLSAAEIEARQMLEYGRMAPMLVRVPLTLEESREFERKSTAAATSANTRNEELAACAASAVPLAEMSDRDVEQCAGYAHYAQKASKGGQWASGGGFDIESKARAAHQVINGVHAASVGGGGARHVVIASGYENAGTRYFQTALLNEFAEFERIEPVHVSSDEALAKMMKRERRRRIALLTGTTWTGSSQTKTARQKQLMKKLFFSDANNDGSIVEVLIVDASMLTGFDAKGATHLHILSPVLNQQQAWSRILRRCAQPVARSTVYVYTYKTYIPDDVKQNKSNRVTITPDELVLEALRRKREVVQPIDLLMKEMIANSYDRYWFAEYSTGGGVKAAAELEHGGAAPVQPLTQQEYVLWRVFDSLVPDELKEEDVADVGAAIGGGAMQGGAMQPIGAAAAAQALGQAARGPGQKGGRGYLLAAAAIAKRARDAAARFFRRRQAAVERRVGELPPLPAALPTPALPAVAAPRNDMHQFAQDFFIGQPWTIADPVRFAQANIGDKKAATIVEHLVGLVQMNLLVDLSLLTTFIADRLSDERRQQITALLDEKAHATPPALMRSFEQYYLLQELANAHYRQVVQRTVQLAGALDKTTKEIDNAAQAIGNAPGPELPPAPQVPTPSPAAPAPQVPPTVQEKVAPRSNMETPFSESGDSLPGQESGGSATSTSSPGQTSSSTGSPASTTSSVSAADQRAQQSPSKSSDVSPATGTTSDVSEWQQYVRDLEMTPVAVAASTAAPKSALKTAVKVISNDDGARITYPHLNVQRRAVGGNWSIRPQQE